MEDKEFEQMEKAESKMDTAFDKLTESISNGKMIFEPLRYSSVSAINAASKCEMKGILGAYNEIGEFHAGFDTTLRQIKKKQSLSKSQEEKVEDLMDKYEDALGDFIIAHLNLNCSCKRLT
jgi:hypothetical protein